MGAGVSGTLDQRINQLLRVSTAHVRKQVLLNAALQPHLAERCLGNWLSCGWQTANLPELLEGPTVWEKEVEVNSLSFLLDSWLFLS